MAGVEGLEPPTPGFGDRCSSQLSYTPPEANAAAKRPGGPPRAFYCRRQGPNASPKGRISRVCDPFPASARTIPPDQGAPYSIILATTPAPTVRPPSRMAKRSFSSIAIGTISVTSIEMLSPGITISVPVGKVTTPVTSVVRK
jgi:hypothetical protein